MAKDFRSLLQQMESDRHSALEDWKSFEGSNEGVYHRSYPGSFSAADAYALIRFPGATRRLGNIAAVSISTHRDTFPVNAMPYVSARGFTQGHRMVAGTLIFQTVDRSVLSNRYEQWYSGRHFIHEHADELPLFDLLITYANEVGMIAYEEIEGIRVLDMGRTISLENLQPAETYSFMALDYHPLRSISHGDTRDPRIFPGRILDRERKTLKSHTGSEISVLDPATQQSLFQVNPDLTI